MAAEAPPAYTPAVAPAAASAAPAATATKRPPTEDEIIQMAGVTMPYLESLVLKASNGCFGLSAKTDEELEAALFAASKFALPSGSSETARRAWVAEHKGESLAAYRQLADLLDDLVAFATRNQPRLEGPAAIASEVMLKASMTPAALDALATYIRESVRATLGSINKTAAAFAAREIREESFRVGFTRKINGLKAGLPGKIKCREDDWVLLIESVIQNMMLTMMGAAVETRLLRGRTMTLLVAVMLLDLYLSPFVDAELSFMEGKTRIEASDGPVVAYLAACRKNGGICFQPPAPGQPVYTFDAVRRDAAAGENTFRGGVLHTALGMPEQATSTTFRR